MFKLSTPIYGSHPTAEFFAPSQTALTELGTRVFGVDPYWGGGEFIYGKAAGAQEMGSVCQWNDGHVFSDHPNTANTGRPIAAAIYPMATNDFGWYMVAGTVVLSASASVAADTAVGITGAGTVGANSAGKQLLGYRNVLPSTTTVVKTATTKNGSNQLEVLAGFGGWFHGITLSGTGIAGGSTITGFDANQRTLTMSANATATGTVSVTGTYTGFVVGAAQNPFIQGAIT